MQLARSGHERAPSLIKTLYSASFSLFCFSASFSALTPLCCHNTHNTRRPSQTISEHHCFTKYATHEQERDVSTVGSAAINLLPSAPQQSQGRRTVQGPVISIYLGPLPNTRVVRNLPRRRHEGSRHVAATRN